ncbi:hypothetical protein GLOIN_2v1671590 [Rhizophagus irregularis DAOM 181602=DAOM 197198]|uniref:Uncharacterized protein n=1 Tax=Rhizophagus irregularis (strain DAOM 181602 / DAOM 197198 / MUCL 43194) TaxID=747089 RepID=A0A2P4PHJ8_RHIID|nr:hypothetical protein GLOIN_2v1671590 [Rhizophagus irregularis DAOM 181602=DAOM 197198]POG64869.1 hypothetical protein GLOIN_2v1671590 [Rhizophagus irregularis DAOM 181602=DAOM 197198]GET51142.1 hypothetical protein GLOIN_2v1671590 [Rhizophagus irregularis DAOM 181602=DAOM 197198]|eukprot:XP_025171735.1 hypothetical protein GLOIN_2v1671590 [Rhizophagus irregularis DAOM 181602=DAOM 197198]
MLFLIFLLTTLLCCYFLIVNSFINFSFLCDFSYKINFPNSHCLSTYQTLWINELYARALHMQGYETNVLEYFCDVSNI